MKASLDTEPNSETIVSPPPRPDLWRSREDYMKHSAALLPTSPLKAQSAWCTRPDGHHLPSLSMVGHSPPTMSSQLLNHVKLPHHDCSLYQVYNDIAEEEESDMTRRESIVDERDVVQAMPVNMMESIWRKQMIKEYRGDPVYKKYQLAQDSSNTSWEGKMEHYRIWNSLLYCPHSRRGGVFVYPKRGQDQWRDTQGTNDYWDPQQETPQRW